MPLAKGTSNISRIYRGTTEIDHLHIGDNASAYDKAMVPVISSFTATPSSFVVSNAPAPTINLAWTVTGADSIALQEVVPYFADNADGVVTALNIPAGHDGSVEVTSAAANAPFGDHFGYVRQGIDDANNARVGMIADEATSKVTLVGGHRNVRFNNDNFHISWTGMPTSGSVYGTWRPTTGNAVNFTMTISNVGAVYNQWSPLTFAGSFYEAHTGNFSPAGTWNAASGLPAGKFFLYTDSARTQQINLRTTPLGPATSITRTLQENAQWLYIRNYGYVLTATNSRGKSVSRSNVQRIRPAVIQHFRMRAGSFSRNNLNNNIRRITLEWEVSGWPHPDLTLAYAPDNAFSHALSLTAADPDRRTTYNSIDSGSGDDNVTITTGSGEAKYRLTATNAGATVNSDFSYNWPA